MRQALWQRRKALLLLAVALISAGLGSLAYNSHLLRRPEQQTIDARFQIRGTDRHRATGVVLVDIDATTFNYFRNHNRPAQWPFPRRYHARVIEELHRAGAKVIAFDVQFTEPTDPADDNALIEAVGHAHNMVLSTTEVGPHGTTDVLGGEAVLRRVDARAANTSVIPDSDGVIRNTQYSIDGLKTFGVAVAEADTGRAVPPSLFGGVKKPVPIDYAGPPGTFPSISYSRVYDGRFPAGMFAGKIVIVGASAPTLQDLHQTPMSGSSPMAGEEILANKVATVLAGIPLRNPSSLADGAADRAPRPAGMCRGHAAWDARRGPGGSRHSWPVDGLHPARVRLGHRARLQRPGRLADARHRRNRARGSVGRQPRAQAAAQPVRGRLGEHRRGGPARLRAPLARAHRDHRRLQDRAGDRARRHGSRLPCHPAGARAPGGDQADRDRARAGSGVSRPLQARVAAGGLDRALNVIPVYEAGEDDGLLFIAMRLVEGTDLAQLLERVGALEPSRAARLIGQLAGALDAAHAHGLVHRDVKPANVLLTLDEPEHLYLTDFGVAKHIGAGEGVTQAGQWVGTLDYLAPEQIRGEAAGAGADIYALAGLLYHCLTGEVPFPRENEAAKLWAHVNAPPPAPSRLRPDLPKAIDGVIARGMAKDPAARFHSAAELAHACAQALGLATDEVGPLRPDGPGDGSGHAERPSAPTVVSE